MAAVTLSKLLSIACPAVMEILHKPYRLGQISARPEGGYSAVLADHANDTYALISWTQADETSDRTANQSADFAKNLLEQAVRMLDEARETIAEEVSTVIWD
jgi:hypothetical protein